MRNTQAGMPRVPRGQVPLKERGGTDYRLEILEGVHGGATGGGLGQREEKRGLSSYLVLIQELQSTLLSWPCV